TRRLALCVSGKQYQRGTAGLRFGGFGPLPLAASTRSLAACLLRTIAAALASSRLSHGLLPSLARGGRPVCWVWISVVFGALALATLWLPAGVEFLRRAL